MSYAQNRNAPTKKDENKGLASGTPLILSGEIYEKIHFKNELVDGVNFAKVDDPQNTPSILRAVTLICNKLFDFMLHVTL